MHRQVPLPAKITVVYKLGEQFEQSEALYLYDLLGNTEAQEVILQESYGMFVLEMVEIYLIWSKIEEANQAWGNGNIRRDQASGGENYKYSSLGIFIDRTWSRHSYQWIDHSESNEYKKEE
mgnify:CR=1 FL=1